MNFGQEELARKNKVLQMVREQTALDELGLGRVRDAFANLMFPGMSTLQRRAKYFAVMPSLYYQASKKKYDNIKDVRAQIVKWEIRLTEMLVNGADDDEEKKTGITGRSMLETAKKDPSKFVKYDPTYIYMSGLRTFGMVRSGMDIYRLIYECSRRQEGTRPKYKASDDDEISDSDDRLGAQQVFSVGNGEVYDFEKGISLGVELTKNEADYLKRHILSSPQSSDSLLAYILRNNVVISPEYEDLESVWRDMPADFQVYMKQYRMGRRFSHFAYLIQLRYNHIMAEFNEQNDEAARIVEKIENLLDRYSDDYTYNAIDDVMCFIGGKVKDGSSIAFVRKAARYVEDKNWTELDKLIIAREKAVKPGRNKLHNPKYKGEQRILPRMYSYRWNEIVYQVIKEIRESE